MMKKLLLLASCLFYTLLIHSQTFTGTGGSVPGQGTQCFTINVSGIGTINTSTLGLSNVCFDFNHPNDDEIEVWLTAPDGTEVPLTIQNGGSGNDYSNTCFSSSATTYIKNGSAPFSGSFIPEGFLGAVNNGQNADGAWTLCIQDRRNTGNSGTLNSWQLTFSSSPAPAAPTMPACSTTLPGNVSCSNATPVCDFTGLCGNTSGSTVRSWPQLTAATCFGIENNTFLTFVASSTTAVFSVWVPSSPLVGGSRGGIQMLAFAGTCNGPVTTYGCFEHIYPSSNSSIPLANNVMMEGLTVGNVYFLMIDGFGGVAATFTIEAISGVNVLNVSPDTSVCKGSSTTLTASGGNGNYNWSPGSGLNTTSGSSVIATPSTTTTYRVTSTNAIGCSLQENVVVTVNDPPVIITQPNSTPQSVCQGNPVSPYVVAGAGSGVITSYQWYLTTVPNNSGGIAIPGANSSSYTPVTAGLGTLYFYCVVTNSFGCSTKSNVTGALTINPKPTAPVGSVTVQSSCSTPTGTIVLTFPTGANIEYSLGGPYQSSGTFTGLAPGTYTATVRNILTGCVSAGTSFSVTTVSSPPATPSGSVTVQPTCTTPTGTIVITSPSGANIEYSIGGAYQASGTFSNLTNGTTYNVYAKDIITGCVSAALPLTVNTITGAPAIPTASVTTQTDCFSATGTITITAPTGSNYEYSIGSAYQSSMIFSGLAPATTFSVTVRNTLTGCVSAPLSLATDPITPPPAPTVTSAISYCQYASASALTAVGSNLLWYTSPSGGAGSGTAPTPSTNIVGSTTYYVSQTTGSCESNRAAITVTIIGQPSAPVVTATVAYCQNTVAPALTATGSNLLWYTAASGGIGSSAAPTPSTTAAGATNYYVSQTINGCESPRSSILVTINGLPPVPLVTAAIAYCKNSLPTALTATGTGLLWYTSASGGTGSPAAPTPSTATPGVTNYYVSQTSNGCEGPRAIITVTVNAIPAAPIVTAAISYCRNTPAVPLTATGANLLWYTTASGGTGSSTAPTPATSSVGTTVYYVSQTVNGCESPRAAISVIVNAVPAAPTVTANTSYCQNAVAIPLTATGSNLLWYSSASGGTASTTAPTPSTTTAGATTFYVSQTINGCESIRSAITVTVNAVPAAPLVTSTISYCQNAVPAALTATGTNLLWYTVSSGGTGLATAPIPGTSSTGTTNYYVSQTVSGCEGPRSMITITVNPNPVAPAVTASVTYCENISPTPLTATGTNLLWYTLPSGGTGTTTVPTPSTALPGTSSYYVSQTINGCESPRATITVSVNAEPAAPSVNAGATYCENEAATVLSATGSNLLWYTTTTGGTGVSAAPIPSTTTAGISTYYVSQTVNGCEGPRASITITVNAAPSTPVVTSNIEYCQDEVVSASLTATGTNLLWYTAASGGIGSAAAPIPTTSIPGTTDYFVSQTLNGCESQRAKISVTVNATPAVPVTKNIVYCRFEASTSLTAAGSNLLWYAFANGGVGSAAAPVPSTSLPGIQTFYVTQTIKGCESPRASMTVTVKPLPLAPVVTSPVMYCQFSAAIPLKANGSNLLWYNVATGGTGSTVAPIPSTSTPGNTFYYVSQTTNGCEGPRAGITVTINKDSTAVTNFGYNPSKVCINGTNPGPALPEDFTAGGVFSATPAGLKIDPVTGNINLALSTPGTYTVTYTFTTANCIKGGSFNTTLQVDPAVPTYTIFSYSSPVCKNAGPVLPATVNNFTTGGTFTSTPGLSINSATGEVNVAASNAGSYPITYRLNALGCRAATSNNSFITISDTTVPVTSFSYTPSTVCITSSSNPSFTPANGFTAGGTFSASPAGLNVDANSGAVNIGLSTPGVYKIKYNIPAFFCRVAGVDSTTFTITAYENPETGFTYFSPVCKRDAVEIPELNTGFTDGGVFSSTAGVSINAQTGVVDLSNSLPGSYTVKYDVAAGACNPAGSSNTALTIIAQPESPTVSNVANCGPGDLTLNASAAGTIKWYTEQELLNQVNVGNTFNSYVENTSNYYVTNTVGTCTSTPSLISAIINPLPVKPFMGNDTAICPNDKLILNPGVYASYLWQDGSINNTYTVDAEGSFKVVVSTNAGCKDSASVTVMTLTSCDDILFPSAFSPNGDGLNDKFGPIGTLSVISNYSMRIFNRYGEVIFSSKNPQERWDGMIKGKKEASAAYVYVAAYLYKNRIARTKKGTVMVIR